MEVNDISDAAKQYLVNLLSTHTSELKNEIDELKSMINKKNDQIDELSTKIVDVVRRNVELSEELRSTREQLEIKIDDGEQF